MKPKIKTYTIEKIFAGCTRCDGEIVNQKGSTLLSLPHDEIIQCKDCGTEHSFPMDLEKIRGPRHASFY